jgi:hypothetical protein
MNVLVGNFFFKVVHDVVSNRPTSSGHNLPVSVAFAFLMAMKIAFEKLFRCRGTVDIRKAQTEPDGKILNRNTMYLSITTESAFSRSHR